MNNAVTKKVDRGCHLEGIDHSISSNVLVSTKVVKMIA